MTIGVRCYGLFRRARHRTRVLLLIKSCLQWRVTPSLISVRSRHRMMLVRYAPVAIDLAQAHGQPEQKAVLVLGSAGGVRSAPQDGDRKGDVGARGNGEFPKVEGRTGLVVTEQQIPGRRIGFDALA